MRMTRKEKSFSVTGYVQKTVTLDVVAKDVKTALEKARKAHVLEWQEHNWESPILDLRVLKRRR